MPISEDTLLALINRDFTALCLLGSRAVTSRALIPMTIPEYRGIKAVSKLLFARHVSMNLEVSQQSLKINARV